MKANATQLPSKLARAPFITVELDADDMEFVGGQTWVQPTYAVRYQVTPYYVFGQPQYDVEILYAKLLSAKAWFGDCAVDVPCGDPDFCLSAETMFNEWLARVGKERVERLCLKDYQGE